MEILLPSDISRDFTTHLKLGQLHYDEQIILYRTIQSNIHSQASKLPRDVKMPFICVFHETQLVELNLSYVQLHVSTFSPRVRSCLPQILS